MLTAYTTAALSALARIIFILSIFAMTISGTFVLYAIVCKYYSDDSYYDKEEDDLQLEYLRKYNKEIQEKKERENGKKQN